MKAAGTQTSILLSVDNNRIEANGKDLSFITIKLKDKEGHVVPQSYSDSYFRLKETSYHKG